MLSNFNNEAFKSYYSCSEAALNAREKLLAIYNQPTLGVAELNALARILEPMTQPELQAFMNFLSDLRDRQRGAA